MCVALREEGPSVEVSPSHTSSLGCAHLIARILRAAHQSRGPASGSTQGVTSPMGLDTARASSTPPPVAPGVISPMGLDMAFAPGAGGHLICLTCARPWSSRTSSPPS